jgi:hypothetical protein
MVFRNLKRIFGSAKEESRLKPEGCECGAVEGEYHKFGCRWEYCPFCERQFAEGCECSYDLLGLKSRRRSPAYGYLPQEIYERGLTQDHQARWFMLCEEKGRIPYVYSPQLCARCGVQWPAFFMVQDRVWSYYTGPGLRNDLLCKGCFREIVTAIDQHHPRPDWLPSLVDVEAFIKAWDEGDKTKLMELEPEKFKT